VSVTTLVEDGIATVRIDDGAMNVLNPQQIHDVHAQVSAAAGHRAVILTGRPGVLTAGLDTKAMAAMTPQERETFFVDFGRMILGIWLAPVPVVCAATGHAIAAGTLVALASDHVVAARGDYRWGMSEARIGLELSDYAIMLVRSRVGPRDADKLLLEGFVVNPETAVQLGLAHESADRGDVLSRATSVARELADLPHAVYARNKERLRSRRGRAAVAGLADDIRRLVSAATMGTADDD
jgi:enoyl-CoA hydratase/carnithine racemase